MIDNVGVGGRAVVVVFVVVHNGIKILLRTIVLQAWVSSVLLSVICRVSNLKDGIFSKCFELEG